MKSWWRSLFQKSPVEKFRKTPEFQLLEEGRLTSLLAKGARFRGDLVLDEGAKIDGHLEGNVRSESAWLVIDTAATVVGSVMAARVILYGRVEGHVVAERILLGPQARIQGDLTYSVMRLAEGAEIDGRMHKREQISIADLPPPGTVVAGLAVDAAQPLGDGVRKFG